jgi:hypothetical protein
VMLTGLLLIIRVGVIDDLPPMQVEN